MKSNICIFCKHIISDHTKDESIECALKLCNKKLVVVNLSEDNDQQEKTNGHQNRWFSD